MSRNEAPSYLFVYGTLRRQAATQRSLWLQSRARFAVEGRVKGRLYRISYYPGLVLSSGAQDWVVGDVFKVLKPNAVYAELDQYEGCGPDDPQPCEYRRVSVPVLLDSGAWIEADTYLYEWSVEDRETIVSGDFFDCD